MTDRSTKDLILDTAERCFAEDGFAATSLRGIIKEAGVNTAAVHYHFGSKEDLIYAVIARRVEPLNRRRLDTLGELEADHSPGPIPLDQIVDAFLRPVMEIQHDSPEDAEIFRKLVGRISMDATIEHRGRITRLFESTGQRFIAALRPALPGLDDGELFWRLHFMVGAMTFAISMPHGDKCPGNLTSPGGSTAELHGRLLRFIVGGLNAPAPATTKEDSR
jgi:AcrR family transcriptional regulator